MMVTGITLESFGLNFRKANITEKANILERLLEDLKKGNVVDQPLVEYVSRYSNVDYNKKLKKAANALVNYTLENPKSIFPRIIKKSLKEVFKTASASEKQKYIHGLFELLYDFENKKFTGRTLASDLLEQLVEIVGDNSFNPITRTNILKVINLAIKSGSDSRTINKSLISLLDSEEYFVKDLAFKILDLNLRQRKYSNLEIEALFDFARTKSNLGKYELDLRKAIETARANHSSSLRDVRESGLGSRVMKALEAKGKINTGRKKPKFEPYTPRRILKP